MLDLFVDTSGWASMVDRKQAFHRQAVEILDESLARHDNVVTTNLVLIELTALLTSPLRISKQRQTEFLDELHSLLEINLVQLTMHSRPWPGLFGSREATKIAR